MTHRGVGWKLDEDGLDRLRQAGRIASRTLREASSKTRPDMTCLEVCELAENMIRDMGARPAFPCNIGIGPVAAHFTPTQEDNPAIPLGSLVKIDLGVELDGYIVDTAATVDLRSGSGLLVEAAGEALKMALRISRAGLRVSEIGRVVYEASVRLGCRPISNLTGHEIGRYLLHAGVSIPNVPAGGSARLEAEKIYAIEPFTTRGDAAGVVVSTKSVHIFALREDLLKRKQKWIVGSAALDAIIQASRGLPYTPRWLDPAAASLNIQLYKRGLAVGYPVLVEKSGAPVAQAEHTILVLEEGCEVLT
jgi:methionyl aminopeptidase